MCGMVGHLAHYCPDAVGHEAPHANAEWLSLEGRKANQEIIGDLQELLIHSGWVSRVRGLCRLCAERPMLLKLANEWRDNEGRSLLSLAVARNLRTSIQLLWASGICCGIDRGDKNSYFILMKACDAYHRERKYDWFTGKSELAARLEREGGMVDAFLRVSLMWNCTDDLDLHVVCPSGEEIYYAHNRSGCGGELDVDMNASDPYSRSPVENVVWAGDDAPVGNYRILVNNYCHRSGLQVVPFVVEVAVQGEEPLRIEGSWPHPDPSQSKAVVHNFRYDPAEVHEAGQQDAEQEEEEDDEGEDAAVVEHMNRLAGTGGSADSLAQLMWLILRGRDPALLDLCISLGLHDPVAHASSCVSPQWCFLQAVWAHNLRAAERLLAACGKRIDINHNYRWDVIPWDETVAQMCWRECHGDERRDRPWMRALAWLAARGADFSRVKLNFHRWWKPFFLQESQIRTYNRLVWHLSDENGWTAKTKSAAAYLARVVRRLANWGAHIPEDLDPDFEGEIAWGVNGRRPPNATSFCHGSLDCGLVQAAVRDGKLTNRAHIMAVLCCLWKEHPEVKAPLRCHILRFLYPHLGRGRLAYAALQVSEGGRIKGPENERVECTYDSPPPRGYVCGRCRQAGHWRKFCPRGRST